MSQNNGNNNDENLGAVRLVDANGDVTDLDGNPVPKPAEKKPADSLTEMPLMALRNITLFPGTVLPVTVGREKSKALVNAMSKTHGVIVAASQNSADVDDPTFDDLFGYGVTATIVKAMNMPDGNITVILHGLDRVSLVEQTQSEPYMKANVRKVREPRLTVAQKAKMPVIVSAIKDVAIEIFRLMESAPAEASAAIRNIDSDSFLTYFVASNIEAPVQDKLVVLGTLNPYERAEKLLELAQKQLQFLKIKDDIQSKAKQGLDRKQREYMLQQQMQTIQDELGDNPQDQLVKEFTEKAAKKKWSKEIEEIFKRELDKFERMNPNSAEFGPLQDYLNRFVNLPWGKCTKDKIDIKAAKAQLDSDHFGLDKVKERVLEHLAVLKLKGDLKSPILCLYGPPGVGKTSLGKSIATAIGRKYVRVSLGGLHDESEIRGHRRTYVGAMPGRIIEGIERAGTSNPVFILDEIDKVSSDFHGDPASALLEVLDPEQNTAFHDNYLDVDYDLSKVMFIATANNISAISAPLLDRMELIPVDGYLMEEKVQIAKDHLLPKEKANHGLKEEDFSISDENIAYVIDKYTRESGVRKLDKVLAQICRKVALRVAQGEELPGSLDAEILRSMLGKEQFDRDIWHDDLRAGVVTGLAWTAVGGEILFVECAASKGKGKMTITGNLGDVMKESAVLALEYVRSNAARFGLEDVDFDQENFHIHVPEGAVPKDGPSAGITMVTAIVSALTGRRVRKRVAMTGEITLRGMVIPVGGITEKILAAKRAGITDIILCEQNAKDIEEIKADYVEGLSFHYVKHIADVINVALEEQPTGIPASYCKLSDNTK